MPEFLRIRKNKFNTLKNLYDEKQLEYSVFYKNISLIIEEIRDKIKQFIDTKQMLVHKYEKIKERKKPPKIPLRPNEKKQASDFLNELLTELENDSNRSEYKKELELFLTELLNEIHDVPLVGETPTTPVRAINGVERDDIVPTQRVENAQDSKPFMNTLQERKENERNRKRKLGHTFLALTMIEEDIEKNIMPSLKQIKFVNENSEAYMKDFKETRPLGLRDENNRNIKNLTDRFNAVKKIEDALKTANETPFIAVPAGNDTPITPFIAVPAGNDNIKDKKANEDYRASLITKYKNVDTSKKLNEALANFKQLGNKRLANIDPEEKKNLDIEFNRIFGSKKPIKKIRSRAGKR